MSYVSVIHVAAPEFAFCAHLKTRGRAHSFVSLFSQSPFPYLTMAVHRPDKIIAALRVFNSCPPNRDPEPVRSNSSVYKALLCMHADGNRETDSALTNMTMGTSGTSPLSAFSPRRRNKVPYAHLRTAHGELVMPKREPGRASPPQSCISVQLKGTRQALE